MSALLSLVQGKSKGSPPSPPSKLEAFLSSLTTYPCFYQLATTDTAGTTRSRRFCFRPAAESARKLVSGEAVDGVRRGEHAAALAPEVHAEFTGFPEACALVALERWCREPAQLSTLILFGTRLADYLEGLRAWQQANQDQSSFIQSKLHLLLSFATDTLQRVLPPPPPELSIPDLVILQQQELSRALTPHDQPQANTPAPPLIEPAVDDASAGVVPFAPAEQQAVKQAAAAAPNPIAQVAQAIQPNIRFIQTTVQAPVTLSRGRSFFEFFQVLLSYVRLWLLGLAYCFFWGATMLRLGGNGLSALGGLFAFTVVVSVILSVLSALIFLSASASDAIGSTIIYLGKFTDIAKQKSAVREREQEETSKLGPRKLPPSSFEQLDDFLMRQLEASSVRRPQHQMMMGSFATPIHALRSRPDIPRLAHDPLLVRCYDLQFIDAVGDLYADIGPNEVAEHFDSSGFFAYTSKATRKVAAVLLLRLLAWRRVVNIVRPAGPGAEPSEALRFVFVSGLPNAGAESVYQFLTGMPLDSKVMPCQHQRTEIRSLVHHSSAYAVLACPHEHSKPGSEAAPHSNWVTDLSHGIVSCLVFTLTTDSLQRYFQPPVSSNAPPPSTTTTGQVGRVSVQENGSPQQEQQQQQGSSKGVLAAELAQLWQALELHKPVLLLVQRDGQERQGDERLMELSRQWVTLLTDEVNRRGLDAKDLTVAPVELCDQPPAGVSGKAQVENWVSQALCNAHQQR